MMGPETYVSVDIEAAGPVPGLYSMLSLGACLVENPESGFYVELRPITRRAVAEAVEVSGLSLEKLLATGRRPKEAMGAFLQWVQQITAGRPPVFVAFNAPFDWSFVNWYFHRYGYANPFGIGALDIKAYYMGLMGTTWHDTTKSRIPQSYQSSQPHTHHALDDARRQAEMFAKMLAAPRVTSGP